MEHSLGARLDIAALREAAQITGLSPVAIESLAQAGQLVAERKGRSVIFKADPRLCLAPRGE